MTIRPSFPTVLVVESDDALRATLLRDLRDLGYLVLAGRSEPEAVEIARVHSRPIHVLLTDDGESGLALAATLHQYRPQMRVVFLTRYAAACADGGSKSDLAVAKVRDLLEPPGMC